MILFPNKVNSELGFQHIFFGNTIQPIIAYNVFTRLFDWHLYLPTKMQAISVH